MADPSGTNTDERRGSRRVGTEQAVRVEPFDDKDGSFVDITPALDAARNGLSFASKHPVYYIGQKLRVTYPFSASVQNHHIGKVVRIQRLDDNFQRISVHLESRA
ncbi:MAG: hypothetical protein HY046_04885 [Acidobacteria bacterium]|nr:hypothetical protein [Acidobacteriota bacterium]